MTYITYGERRGIAQGLWEGIAAVLELRFGPAGDALMPEIQTITDVTLLRSIMDRLKTATTLDEVRSAYAPGQ